MNEYDRNINKTGRDTTLAYPLCRSFSLCPTSNRNFSGLRTTLSLCLNLENVSFVEYLPSDDFTTISAGNIIGRYPLSFATDSSRDRRVLSFIPTSFLLYIVFWLCASPSAWLLQGVSVMWIEEDKTYLVPRRPDRSNMDNMQMIQSFCWRGIGKQQ